MFQPWSKKDSGQKIRKRKNEKIRSMTSTVELFHMIAIGKLRNIHPMFYEYLNLERVMTLLSEG